MQYCSLQATLTRNRNLRIIIYESKWRKAPFKQWFKKLKDLKGKAKTRTRLNRLKLNNYGDFKYLQQGTYELRINFGPGYRVYFAKLQNEEIVLLLNAGSKQTQEKDINKAINYWKLFKERFNHE